jgi:gluconate kinase
VEIKRPAVGIYLKFTEESFVSCSAVLNKEDVNLKDHKAEVHLIFITPSKEASSNIQEGTNTHTHTSISFAAVAVVT